MESFAKSLLRNSSEFTLMSLICFDGFSLHPNIAHPTKKRKNIFFIIIPIVTPSTTKSYFLWSALIFDKSKL